MPPQVNRDPENRIPVGMTVYDSDAQYTIAELAKRVAALQIEDHLIDDLIHRLDTLEDQVEEIQD